MRFSSSTVWRLRSFPLSTPSLGVRRLGRDYRVAIYPSVSQLAYSFEPLFLLDGVLRSLQDSLAVLSDELVPVHARLVNVRRQLVALAAKQASRLNAQMEITAAAAAAAVTPPVPSTPPKKTVDKEEEESGDQDTDPSKTPTKEVPNPEPPVTSKLKAELKPLQEELRRIDSLSICSLISSSSNRY